MQTKNLPQAKTGDDGISLTSFLNKESVKAQLSQAVGKNSMRFVSSVISAVTVNQELRECTNQSILSAALLGESLNLSPSPQLGQYYMVPYENKKEGVKVAQFQMGYKGYIQLAIRSGQYRKLNVLAVKEGELVRFDPLSEEIEVRLIEDEEARERAKTVGYYAMFEYMNGFKKAIYWSKAKMLSHADRYSKAFYKDGNTFKYKDKKTNKWMEKKRVPFADYEAGNFPEEDEWIYSSFWYKDFDGMAYKTMLRQLISKWGVMSVEMQKAYEGDMAQIREDGTKRYVDSPTEPDEAGGGYEDSSVSSGATDAFAINGLDGQRELDLGGDVNAEVK